MMLRRQLVILGLIGVIVAVVLGGTAYAQTPPPAPTPTPSPQAKTNYREFYLDQLAKNLGITREQLNTAITQARNATVDQAVKDGKLTQDQANKIKSRPATGPYEFHHMKGQGGYEGTEPMTTPAPSTAPTSPPAP